MRYVNQLRKEIIVKAYEMNEVKVPKQYLNDTSFISIEYETVVSSGKENMIGLMQGFATLPISKSTHFFIWSYLDLDYRLELARNYANESRSPQ